VFIKEDLLLTPCTIYPFDSRSSARYDPSCPVTPVINAVFNVKVFLE
jgi:hypothetical protein